MTNHNRDIGDRVKQIIVEQLGLKLEQVVESASLAEDLGADSLEVVQIVMEIEEAFDIEVPDDLAETIVTVGDAIEFVIRKTQK
ncbi:MAG TPA: acyl carrier protein [Pseudorhizobium sp.]|jgi:acyl carrier protein|nr:acyl carrier protein [Pseudorhizobium sp.]